MTVAAAVLICLLLLFSLPTLFHAGVDEIAEREINNHIDGTLSFSHLDISLISDFPKITVTAENMKATSSDVLLKVDWDRNVFEVLRSDIQ